MLLLCKVAAEITDGTMTLHSPCLVMNLVAPVANPSLIQSKAGVNFMLVITAYRLWCNQNGAALK